MRYYITAARTYDNAQIIYNLLANKIKDTDTILLTSDHKWAYQPLVFHMAKQLGLPLVIDDQIEFKDDCEIIKLEEWEESLNV